MSICWDTAQKRRSVSGGCPENSHWTQAGFSISSAFSRAPEQWTWAADHAEFSIYFQSGVGKNGTVVGIEQNKSTLDLARQFIAERELWNVELLHGDAKATGLPRASCDVVHARLVLVNLPEPHQVVKEMVALARPRGIVASHEADWGASICDPPSRAWDRLVAVFKEYSRSVGIDLFVGRKTHQMFQEAGLVNVQVIPLIHSYPLGNSRRNILCDLLESVHDRVVMRGLLTEVEYQEELSRLKRHLADASTLVIPHLFFQIWGRKPE